MSEAVLPANASAIAARRVFFGLAIAAALLAPVVLMSEFQLSQLTRAVIAALAVLGLNLVTGYSGQISLGHGAFFAVGAYTTALLMEHAGWSFWLTLPVSGAVCAAVGFAIGFPALRLGGLYLALVTFSLAVAVPFLWRPLPWKRLLAYSTLEHMGVIALGIGFGHPVAIAGVVLHVAGHALAKALGFWAAVPLLALQPQTARIPPSGLARSSPATAGAVGLSLASLAGLPPSPLFFSEIFVLLGGALAGQLWVSVVAGSGGVRSRRQGIEPTARRSRTWLAIATTAGTFG